ncbi:MAG TPA: serine hydrolase domain-containing protein [Patescibacteria group bacterium]|nr:serine hydrolase domain-containing protein [Patescibacteria group bacterium]
MRRISFYARTLGLVVATGVVALMPLSSALALSDLQSAADSMVGTGLPGVWGVDSAGDSAASGVANVGTSASTQAGMKDRIGSVTKAFMGEVTLQLVAEHTLHLSDSVEQWVPGLLPYGSDVTVKQLLNHTSGIPDYLESGDNPLLVQFIRESVPGNPEYDPTFKNTVWTPAELVGLISSQPRDVIPAGNAEYSDSNYIVLGMVLEAASGQSVGTLLQNRIITPLNLTHTSFPTTQTGLPGLHSHGYTFNVDTDGVPLDGTLYDITNYNTSFVWATGAIISNPTDLNTFMRAMVGNTVPGHHLPNWLVTAMTTTVPITLPAGLFPAGFGAGLGLWSWNIKASLDDIGVSGGCNKTIYGEEGEVPGFDTWSFTNSTGSRAISMGVNQMVPDFDTQYYAANGELPQYGLLWCR